MLEIINHIIGLNHLMVSSFLLIPIFIIMLSKNVMLLKKILFYLLIFNFISFYLTLFVTGTFNYKFHLPLHLCYITEFVILLSFLLKSDRLYPWLVLNSMLGGFVGLINSNLPFGSSAVEYVHFYLSHFNLVFFTIIIFKLKMHISFNNFLRSIMLNTFLLVQVSLFNNIFNTNYWFTLSKPRGVNVAVLFPDWPYYLFMFIGFGLISYSITYILLLGNRLQR